MTLDQIELNRGTMLSPGGGRGVYHAKVGLLDDRGFLGLLVCRFRAGGADRPLNVREVRR